MARRTPSKRMEGRRAKRMKPICSEWEERLSLYVDGLLNPFDENAVEAHLARCEACREAVALWRAVGASVRRLPRELPPAELRARILASTTRRLGIRQRLRLGWWHLAPALAAGLLLAWWSLPRFTPTPLLLTRQPESTSAMRLSNLSDMPGSFDQSDLPRPEAPPAHAESRPAGSETRILIVVQPAAAPRWQEPAPRWVANTRAPAPQISTPISETRAPTHDVAMLPSSTPALVTEVADLPLQAEWSASEPSSSSGERNALHASPPAPSESDALRRWTEQFNQQLQQENRRAHLKRLAPRSNSSRLFVPLLSWNIK
jgi:hypothetical protein